MKDKGRTSTGRRLAIKARASTDPDFGIPPDERSMEDHIRYGVINLDKPSGPTSHEVVSWIKDMMGLEKTGHGGTLDPKVTGVLPVALDESTKVVQSSLPGSKEYVCLMRLHGDVGEKKLRETFREFVGEIVQRPPMRSAVKRRIRTRVIHSIDLLEVQGRDALFRVGCEAGTYIRKLCHDVGEVLGCGAHMFELRRTMSGPFSDGDAVTLHDLVDAYAFWKKDGMEDLLRKAVMPVEKALEDLPRVVVRDSAVDALCHGADLAVPGISEVDVEMEKGGKVGLFTLKGELIALGDARMDTKDVLVEDSGIAVKTKRVVMKPGVYPRMWKKEQPAD